MPTQCSHQTAHQRETKLDATLYYAADSEERKKKTTSATVPFIPDTKHEICSASKTSKAHIYLHLIVSLIFDTYYICHFAEYPNHKK